MNTPKNPKDLLPFTMKGFFLFFWSRLRLPTTWKGWAGTVILIYLINVIIDFIFPVITLLYIVVVYSFSVLIFSKLYPPLLHFLEPHIPESKKRG